MPVIASSVKLTTVRYRPIEAGTIRVTPESQALTMRLPFGGLVWHRPTAVVVEQAGQVVQRLPILDVTRVAQLGIVLGTLLLTVVCLIVASRSPEES